MSIILSASHVDRKRGGVESDIMGLSGAALERLDEIDPDRMSAARFAPVADREALILLYAFHAELTRIPESVTEPLIGQIRYQWWRDFIEAIYEKGNVPLHDVGYPLAGLIQKRALPRFWFDKLIDGRERDLDPQPLDGIEEARAYARNTSVTLMQIAAAVLGEDAEDVVQAAGEAWGLMSLARSWRYHKNSLLNSTTEDELRHAAMSRIRETGKVSAAILPAVAYAALVPLYAKSMARSDYDSAKSEAEISPIRKRSRLFRTALTGRLT